MRMKIIKLDAIDSTNSYLKKLLAKEPLNDFTVVISKHQTKGRGRNGNAWTNDASLNLAISIYKRFNDFKISDKFVLNIISSLSVFQLLSESKLNKLTIKWPNDIMAENKKISGILIENNVKGKFINHSVIGVGINVNQKKFKNLPNATSMFIESGTKLSIDLLASSLCEKFNKNFHQFQKNEKWLLNSYNNYLFKKNIHSNFITENGKRFSGKVIRVNKNGELTIMKANKQEVIYSENTIRFEI